MHVTTSLAQLLKQRCSSLAHPQLLRQLLKELEGLIRGLRGSLCSSSLHVMRMIAVRAAGQVTLVGMLLTPLIPV
jgi:hypothetical protein